MEPKYTIERIVLACMSEKESIECIFVKPSTGSHRCKHPVSSSKWLRNDDVSLLPIVFENGFIKSVPGHYSQEIRDKEHAEQICVTMCSLVDYPSRSASASS